MRARAVGCRLCGSIAVADSYGEKGDEPIDCLLNRSWFDHLLHRSWVDYLLLHRSWVDHLLCQS